MSASAASGLASAAADPMALDGIDFVELYVGNADQAAYFYTHALGFRRVAHGGLSTGLRDRASHVLEQGSIRLVITSGLLPSHPIARHVATHGDSVKTVALAVPDAARAHAWALERGAASVAAPRTAVDDHGELRLSAIAAYGDVVHAFVERSDYRGPFMPGYEPCDDKAEGVGLRDVDHVVGNVEMGAMERWVGFYARVFGMTELSSFTGEAISTEYSALMSKVVSDGSGRIKFPINEPAEGRRRSQVDEFLQFNGGPGVQHLALTTDDIVSTVAALRARGIEFLRTPDAYYDELPARVGEIEQPLEDLRRLGILVDRDDEGHLLQVFSHPLGDRPTLFLEVIERHGARGFGQGNFKALFEALEREQERRGNL